MQTRKPGRLDFSLLPSPFALEQEQTALSSSKRPPLPSQPSQSCKGSTHTSPVRASFPSNLIQLPPDRSNAMCPSARFPTFTLSDRSPPHSHFLSHAHATLEHSVGEDGLSRLHCDR